ncbi:Uncharacterised protein [Vibrio cholerae]|nr:Uncharacterised protein [Vibrio cholerae]
MTKLILVILDAIRLHSTQQCFTIGFMIGQ